MLELDAQPRLESWTNTLRHVAACLPSLAELMTYVSSRVPQEELGRQLLSLTTFVPQLRKLELRCAGVGARPYYAGTGCCLSRLGSQAGHPNLRPSVEVAVALGQYEDSTVVQFSSQVVLGP